MGYTKYDYEKYINALETELEGYVKEVAITLPVGYSVADIIEAVKQYYPFEWRIINERYIECRKADEKLKRLGKKPRYLMSKPEVILADLKIVKELLKDSRLKHYENYIKTSEYQITYNDFVNKRNQIIARRQTKIDKALERTQRMEPLFLDKLMGLYERKNTSMKDRVYILLELEKYYCHKVVSFFKKVAHSELNFQLREEAVRHLLSLGHYAKLRKQKYMQCHVNNKKRKKYLKEIYAKERFDIRAIPQELEYRIDNAKEQKIKNYDYFISHSSSDFLVVQDLIYTLNDKGKNIYCDWINDADYLKRNLVCNATLEVIKKRLEQSKAVIFVDSLNSRRSQWVKYELNYFKSLGKIIYTIGAFDIEEKVFKIEILKDFWFVDKNYENINLYLEEE